MAKAASLILIPSSLGEGASQDMMAPITQRVIKDTSHYIVEDLRSARRFLRWMDRECDIDSMHFEEIGKNNRHSDNTQLLEPALSGNPVGLISEAGAPGIADPGADIVAKAHELGIPVKPISGPSSFYLALMSSGMNGQQFRFHGYVPKEQKERGRKLLSFENEVNRTGETQIFMDAPYRNQHVLEDALNILRPNTKLCLALDLTLPTEFIKTRTISEWKKKAAPDIRKRPCVFLIGN